MGQQVISSGIYRVPLIIATLNKHWLTQISAWPEPDPVIYKHPAPRYPGAICDLSSIQSAETSSILAVLLPVDSSFWSLILTLTFWNSSTVTSLLPEVLRT